MKTAKTLATWATAGAPDVTQKLACVGTPIESTSYAIGGKAFLFVQAKKGATVIARFKLDGSLAEAKQAGCERLGEGGAPGRVLPRHRAPVDPRESRPRRAQADTEAVAHTSLMHVFEARCIVSP